MHTFGDWLRLLLEELFVIDAPALYMSRDRGGRLTALLPIDGATIKPVIDDWGRTLQPFEENGATVYPVAYQQILKGYAAVDYSVRDLIYRPRNIRVNRAYGFSPVEQVITTVNVALRRQMFLLDYFTQGNIPDSLIGVPESWTPDQIASYQKYWDAYFGGELGRRRRAKFVPGGVAKTFIQTKEPDLKGPFDEWLARIVCFAFSISPQALTQQMNRATAETQKDLAEEEGLAPVLAWVKDLIDSVIAQEFNAPDLEFAFSAEASVDPQQQEAILSSYTSKGILTINEARAALGRNPLAEPAANKPMALTGAGYVPLGQVAQGPSKSAAVSDLTKLDKDGVWEEDEHPRWPTGSTDHQGGRFAPKGEEGSSSGRTGLTNDCDEEWATARKICEDLLALHEFHPDRALLGGHTTVDGCAKGFVSERCGGNKV
jgi:Phage portal protein